MVPPSRPTARHTASASWRPASGGALARALPVVLVLAIVGATIGAVLAFSSARSLAQAQDRRARADALVEIKAELSWLHHELLVNGVLAYHRTGSATPPDGFDRLLVERDDLLGQLDDLAATSSDSVGRSATELAARVRDTPIEAWPVELWSVENLHYETMPFVDRSANGDEDQATSGPSATVTTAGLIDGAQTVPLPRLVLLDVLALDLASSPEPLPDWAADFLAAVAGVVIDNPGWFGPDPDRPLADHVMTSSGSSTPPLVGTAVEGVSASLDLVVEYDRWLVAGGPQAGPPPASIEELAAAAEVTTDAMIEAVRDGFEARRSTGDRTLLGTGPIPARFLLGALLSVAAIVLIVVGVIWWNRHRHRLAAAAYTDALTGAGNRRYLDDVVADQFRRSGQTHMLAMLDMDRFKLVNDTWGHDAGDAILRALSGRLQHQAQAFCRSSPGSSSVVVRLGGDEFVVVAHGPLGFDTAAMEQRLRAAAGPVDLGRGDVVHLTFSLGTAVSTEPCQLADLLKAADLATYEDKQRPPAGPPARPVVVDVAALEAR